MHFLKNGFESEDACQHSKHHQSFSSDFVAKPSEKKEERNAEQDPDNNNGIGLAVIEHQRFKKEALRVKSNPADDTASQGQSEESE